MSKTKIEWSEFSWNPVVGCTKVSEGCQNCYAARFAHRLNNMLFYKNPEYIGVADKNGWTGKIELCEHRLEQPLHWRKPRRIFVCSMGDLFHEKVPYGIRHKVFSVMIGANRHTYLLLTKRPKQMLEFMCEFNHQTKLTSGTWKHIYFGVTCENQRCLDKRWAIAQQIPAAKLFISAEPLLENIQHNFQFDNRKPDWLIVGAESGPKRRPCKLEWVKSIIDQCDAAGVPVFVKQLSINGKVEHDIKKFPKWAQRREYSDVKPRSD